MNPLLELDNLYYRYPGQQFPALKGASLSIPTGRKLAVVGRNGCGKSTLFLHCNGVLRPAAGEVRLHGHPVSYDRPSLLELRRRVGIVFQNPEDQLFAASVAQDISFGPLNLGLSPGEVQRRIQKAAEECEIVDLLDRPVHALSAGQKTRVALAGVLAMDPQLLVVDELLGNLDPWMRSQLLAVLQRLADRGTTVLMSTHDLAVAFDWADLLVVMHDGQVMAVDSPERVSGDPDLMRWVCPPNLWGPGATHSKNGSGTREGQIAFSRISGGG